MSTLPPLPSLSLGAAETPEVKVPVAIAHDDATALLSKANSFLRVGPTHTEQQFQGAHYHPWNKNITITAGEAGKLRGELKASHDKFKDAPPKTRNILIWNDFAPKVPELLKKEVITASTPPKSGRRRPLKANEGLRPAKVDISPAAFSGSKPTAKIALTGEGETKAEEMGTAHKTSEPRSR